ncbi:CRISPR-associated endoribonuclease Cas6 [Calidifontibacillus erzurumensis]|uniref:CRISPR-associated endoribonuclease Cas6 n=1 Tax=Calidifontibacillus erzurumensis TaxID=2741433 RepID=UPI0035B56CCE
MRVRLNFKITEFPLAYRLLILSYIKQAVRSQSESFYHSFFVCNEKQAKPFVFAPYFQNLEIKDDLIYAENLQVTVTSSNLEFLIYLINGCQQNKNFSYKNYSLLLTKVELLKEKQINKSKVWFKTLSPILIETKEGKPVLPNSNNFEKELNYITSKIIESIDGRELYRPLTILASNLKKSVIKENYHQSQSNYLFYTASKGSLCIEGHPCDLNFIYQNGLGLRRSTGFGCLEIIE